MAARTSASMPGLVVLRQPTLAEIRNGLPASFLDHLKDALEVTETQLASVGRNRASDFGAAQEPGGSAPGRG